MLFCLKLFSIVFLAFTALFSIVSLSTSYWLENSQSHHQGLWYYCNQDFPDDCQLISDNQKIIDQGGIPDWHYVTAVCLACACCLQLFALLCSLPTLLVRKLRILYIICVATLALSWVLVLIAMSVYTQKFQHLVDGAYNWGYSFVLAWFSFVFNLFCIVFFFSLYMLERKTDDEVA